MSEQYKRAKKLFLAACDLEPERRAAFLDQECSDNGDLRAEVEELLAHDHEALRSSVVEPDQTVRAAPEKGNGEPRQIGSYRVIRELGRGGMGVVYLAIREGDRF